MCSGRGGEFGGFVDMRFAGGTLNFELKSKYD